LYTSSTRNFCINSTFNTMEIFAMPDYFKFLKHLCSHDTEKNPGEAPSSLKDRRSFLKAAVFGASAAIFSRPAFLHAEEKAAPSPDLNPRKLPEGRLSLYNIHTEEKLTVTYRKESGDYDAEALKALNWILRCHYTNLVANIDIAVLEIVNLVGRIAGGDRMIHVISGFRSSAYNQLLAREGHGVAKHSLHMLGKAIDFRIPAVDLFNIRETAMKLHLGGVGYYPKSDFVHLDSGRFRFW
jgi:uncharacterized protein YcbK (DUF882 family)